MNNYGTRIGLTLVALVLALALPAKAQSTLTQTATFTNLFDGGTAGTHGALAYNFAQFDPTLGTLVSVEFSLSGVDFTNGSTASVQNGSHSPQAYTNVYLNGDYDLTDLNTNFAESFITSSPPYTSGTIASGATYTTPATTNAVPGTANSGLLTSAGNLAFYTGTGTATLDLNSYNSVSVTGTSPTTSANSYGSGNITLTYIYTVPVPEPSQTVAWMMVLGLGLVVGRKFVRRSVTA